MAFRRTAENSRTAGNTGSAPKLGAVDVGTVGLDVSVDLTRLIVDEITWYMREHKVSRAELAQTMNVSPGRVSQVLSGDENLTLRTLSSVLSALGAQVDF